MSHDMSLSDEILSIIPTDPYEQLDLARKITSMAIASRVSTLDSQVQHMRQRLADKDTLIDQLQHKATTLENNLSAALQQNAKLSKERDALAMSTKKLSRDLAKLETFKTQLLQSLNDDNSPRAEIVDIGTYDQSMPKAYPDSVDEGSIQQYSYNAENSVDKGSKHNTQRFALSPYITPHLTPNGTPRISSTSGSPRRYSAAGSPRLSGTASPAHSSYDERSTPSPWFSSSQQSSAANSPTRSRSLPGSSRNSRIDGKEFFRQARNRLSYEQFSAFLANIKDLNGQKQTREETLRKAEDIFGTENKDLYISFQALLNRSTR